MSDKMDGWTWKSADAEAEDPPHDDRQWVVPRRTVAESARATAAWFRAKWIRLTTVLVVLALAVGGWQTYTYLTRYHEQMSGPHGDFPAALGSGAPLRPDRVLAHFDNIPDVVSGGLVLNEDSDGHGITARSIRTGKSYWHYGREKTELLFETVSGDTAVLWFEDRLAVSVDLRSGKPRWHVKVPGKAKLEESRIWARQDTVLVSQSDSLTALSVRDGKRLWSAPPPQGCKKWDHRRPVDLKGVEAFDATGCRQERWHDGVLYGMDVKTGRPRWHIQDEMTSYWRLDDHTLAALSLRGSLLVTDVSGKQPRTRSDTLSDDLRLGTIGDGMALLTADGEKSLTAVRVGDKGSKISWNRKAPKSDRFGIPRVADGRVYVVQSLSSSSGRHDDMPGHAQLLVLDARTGHELHRTQLPESLFDGDDLGAEGPGVVVAKYGVVMIGWPDAFLSYSPLLTLSG